MDDGIVRSNAVDCGEFLNVRNCILQVPTRKVLAAQENTTELNHALPVRIEIVVVGHERSGSIVREREGGPIAVHEAYAVGNAAEVSFHHSLHAREQSESLVVGSPESQFKQGNRESRGPSVSSLRQKIC